MKTKTTPVHHGVKIESEGGENWLTVALCDQCGQLHGELNATDPVELLTLLQRSCEMYTELLDSVPALDPAHENQH